MGAYTTKLCDNKTLMDIIINIRDGYEDFDGIPHKPNPQIAMILTLQANLGCRIGDIVNMEVESIIFDGEAWRLDIKEQKTGKSRPFTVPTRVKETLDKYCADNGITSGKIFTIKKHAVWKQMRNVTRYLGLDNISTHSFRKNAAYRTYINSGKDIALTTQFLNHSSPATSLLYLKRSSKQMDDVLNKECIIV